MSSPLGKLQVETVRHMICSHPYQPVSREEPDLLAAAIRLALAGISKLNERCRSISNPELEHSLHLLQTRTEQLQKLVKLSLSPSPSPIAAPLHAFSRNNSTRPWANPEPTGAKGKPRK